MDKPMTTSWLVSLPLAPVTCPSLLPVPTVAQGTGLSVAAPRNGVVVADRFAAAATPRPHTSIDRPGPPPRGRPR